MAKKSMANTNVVDVNALAQVIAEQLLLSRGVQVNINESTIAVVIGNTNGGLRIESDGKNVKRGGNNSKPQKNKKISAKTPDKIKNSKSKVPQKKGKSNKGSEKHNTVSNFIENSNPSILSSLGLTEKESKTIALLGFESLDDLLAQHNVLDNDGMIHPLPSHYKAHLRDLMGSALVEKLTKGIESLIDNQQKKSYEKTTEKANRQKLYGLGLTNLVMDEIAQMTQQDPFRYLEKKELIIQDRGTDAYRANPEISSEYRDRIAKELGEKVTQLVMAQLDIKVKEPEESIKTIDARENNPLEHDPSQPKPEQGISALDAVGRVVRTGTNLGKTGIELGSKLFGAAKNTAEGIIRDGVQLGVSKDRVNLRVGGANILGRNDSQRVQDR